MPVLEKIVNFGTMEQIAEGKTFNNMSSTEGFEYPYPQYNSSVLLLEACYDLLEQAGYKNIAKDTEAQSLDIWGMKLFFVNIYHQTFNNNNTFKGCSINIAAPGVNYPYYENCDYNSDSNKLCNKVTYNHFLQRSVYDDYSNTGAVTSSYVFNSIKDYPKWLEIKNSSSCYISPGFHGSVKINKTNNIYSFAVILRCSNDNIVFTVQTINNENNTRNIEQPLFNIFKGRDVVNEKDILVLGKTLERAPFFCSDIVRGYTNPPSDSYKKQMYCYDYFIDTTKIKNYDGTKSGQCSSEYLTPYYSALICSGNNIIYYTDDLYTPLSDTLYLDWRMNKNQANNVIEKGNAYGNYGKYMLNGVNQIISHAPVTQGRYYDLDEEKYWCKHNILTTEYGNCKNDITFNSFTNYSDNTYNNPTNDSLMNCYNLFGYGAYDFVNLPATKSNYLYARDKQTTSDLLNPAILIRIDDEITED